jgi:predicted MFS family arabinose efflux permease
LITAIGIAVGMVIVSKLKPIDGHLAQRSERNAFSHLFATVSKPDYLRGFAATVFLATGGFMLMPFASAFTVHNLGIDIERLPVLYMSTGIFSIVAGPLLGRLSDSIGKYRTLFGGTLVGMAVVIVYCRLGITPFWMVIALNVVLFVAVSARMISSSALNSAVPEPKDRGAYVSVSASIQQISGGLASALAGVIVVQTQSGKLERYDLLGDVVIVAMAITLGLMYSVHKLVQKRTAALAAARPAPVAS